MRNAILLITAAFLLQALYSCGTVNVAQNTKTEYRDTTIYQDRLQDTTIYVPIPLEKGQAIVTVGDTSKLETSVARSTASIDARGKLNHTLENKSDQKLQAIVPVHSKVIYHGVTSNKAEILTRTIYKEKELTWWQNVRLKAFWPLLVAVLLLLLLLWNFRKPLLKLFV